VIKPLTFTRDVAASPQALWDALVDWPRQGQWMPATVVRAVAQGGEGVGARVEARTGYWPLRVLDSMTVTEWEPPRRCAVEHTGRVIKGSAWFEVLPLAADRSLLVWREELVAPFGLPDAVAGLVLRPATAVVIRIALNRVARQVAQAARATRAPTAATA
jgi:carbon monoxide dehydrogenase subunit G